MNKKHDERQKEMFAEFLQPVKNKKKPSFTFVDLFAGVGGMRIAFESVGGKCVFSSEWDPSCQKTYAANFGEVPHGDITKTKADQIDDFDFLVAGFPCQPFSSIGQRQGFMHATQGTLFYDVLRILKEKRKSTKPKAFLLENVQGLVTHNNGNTLDVILAALDEIGYKVFWDILDAKYFGVPQQRKRIYIVGFRKDLFGDHVKFEFPEENGELVDICDFLEKGKKGYSISKHLQKSYLFKKNDGRPIIVDFKHKGPVKTLVASYHKIQRLTGTFVKDGETGIRLLTESECKAIMGFDKNFIIPVSRTQMYRQMGNSVAIPVVKAIAKKIVQKLRTSKS